MTRITITIALLVGLGLPTPFVHGDITTDGLILDLNADVGTPGAEDEFDDVFEWENQVDNAGGNVIDVLDSPVPFLVEGPNDHRAIILEDGAKLAGDDEDAFDSLVTGSGHTWFAVVTGTPQDGLKNAIFGTLLNENPWTGTVAHVSSNDDDGVVANFLTRSEPTDLFATGITDFGDDEFHILAGRLPEGVGEVMPEVFVDSANPEAQETPAVAMIVEDSDSGPLTIGAERVGGGESYEGAIARILIYDRPLSNDELNITGTELGELYDLTWTQPELLCDPNSLGDLDGSGDVAFADFLILSANFGTEVTSHSDGDIDCSGDVAFADFLILSANFGTTVGGAESVPEPSTNLSLLLGFALVLLCRGNLAQRGRP